jgi:hypothetical protein
MDPNNLLDILINFALGLTTGGLIKFIFVSLIFLYLFFAFAVWRQVHLMSSVVEVGDTSILKIISLFHLFAAIFVFILSFVLI